MPGENDCLNDINETKVCRDFLRNVCRRGKRCRYLHPDDLDPNGPGVTNGACRTTFLFCHDYQNGQGCKREDCKFLHCTTDEEQYFKNRGKLPDHVIDMALSKGALEVPPRPGEPPVCKDFLKGECRRGGQCKFRHLTKREFERELGYGPQSPPHQPINEMQPPLQPQLQQHVQQPLPPQPQPPLQQQPLPIPQPPPQPQMQHQPSPMTMVQFSHASQLPDGDQKRFHYAPAIATQPAPATNVPPPNHRHHPYSRLPNTQPPTNTTEVPPGMMVLHTHTVAQAPQPSQPSPPYGLHQALPAPPQHRLLTPAEARFLMLEEENVVLRRRLEELKKQVSDLTVTNEFLLDQNAQLRLGSKRTTTSLAALTVPAVTITNAGQPLPAQITSAQTPTQQQMMVATGTLRTVAASVAAVPVSIATVAGTPVSIATVSMAPVSMQPPVVTMAQQSVVGVSQTISVSGPPPPTLTGGAPPQGGQTQSNAAACSQSLPLAITAGATPLVTYPIPVLQTSLSH